MLKTEDKLADSIYTELQLKDITSVAPLSYGLALWIEAAEKDVSNQLLGLAATLICMLQRYGLSHIDVLSTAENIVFSDNYNNMQPAFKTIMGTFKTQGEN